MFCIHVQRKSRLTMTFITKRFSGEYKNCVRRVQTSKNFLRVRKRVFLAVALFISSDCLRAPETVQNVGILGKKSFDEIEVCSLSVRKLTWHFCFEM